MFAYRKLSCQILENYIKKKRYLTLNIYELDYLLSAIEIGKDIVKENEERDIYGDALISLFNKTYKKHRKYKKQIKEFHSSNNEAEKVQILKKVYEQKLENT